MVILAVFRSRAQSLDYAERLKKYGVQVTTMQTPREARIGCGLCVRMDSKQVPKANAILKLGKYTAFKGFYKMDFTGGKLSLLPYVWHKQG